MRNTAKHIRCSLLICAAGLMLTLSLLLASCAPFGTSKKERVERFQVDLNESREFVYQNFLEEATVQYADIRDKDPGETWDVWFPLEYPAGSIYTFTLDTVFGNPIEGTVEGPALFGFPKSVEFTFARSGVYWYLERLKLGGTTIVD